MSLAEVCAFSTAEEPRRPSETLQQVLGRLERDPDVVLAAERQSDRAWQAMGAANAGTPESRIMVLAAAFADALDERYRLTADRASEGLGWDASEAGRRQAEFDKSWDRLQGLAGDLATISAASLQGIKIKALVMREFIEENSDDLIHLLAASLVNDLSKLQSDD